MRSVRLIAQTESVELSELDSRVTGEVGDKLGRLAEFTAFTLFG